MNLKNAILSIRVAYLFFLMTIFHLFGTAQTGYHLQWAKSFGSTNGISEEVHAMHQDASGNIYIGGFYSIDIPGTVDFDPNAGIAHLSLTGPYVSAQGSYFAKYDNNGNYIWARGLQPSQLGTLFILSICTDSEGNLFVASSINGGTVDMDPGPGIAEVSAQLNLNNIVIAKYDINGNFLWMNVLGSAGMDSPTEIKTDNQGNIYLTGGLGGSADFDPGPGTAVLPYAGESDIFIAKYNNNGNYLWAKAIGGSGTDSGSSLDLDPNGNIYITGRFRNTVDFDPGPGIANLTSVNNGASFLSKPFVAKYDNDGNYIWAINPTFNETTVGDRITKIIATSDGIYISGTFSGTVDFTSETGGDGLVSQGSNDIFIAKFNELGQNIWAKHIGGTFPESYPQLNIDAEGNVYSTGAFRSTIDADGGIDIVSLTSNGDYDIFVAKYSSDGTHMTSMSFGGTQAEIISGIFIDDEGFVSLAGTFRNQVDFDLSEESNIHVSNGQADIFIARYAQEINHCSGLYIQVDSTASFTCSGNSGYIGVQAIGGQEPYSYHWNETNSTEPIITPDTWGIFNLTVTDVNQCVRTLGVLINQPPVADLLDVSGFISADVFALTIPQTNVYLNAWSNSCELVTGQIRLVIDTSKVTYNWTNQAPDFISGDTLIWDVASLNHEQNFSKQLSFSLKPGVMFGDFICFDYFVVLPEHDVNPLNNVFNVCYPAMIGYDPNDKQVIPQGKCEEKFIDGNSLPLKYIIRFQNTGNWAAFNIAVVDTLNALLNLQTLRVVAQSHAMITEIVNDSIVCFRFNQILLPDSASNEPESHGYVIFEIEPYAFIPSGGLIQNSAAIFFDYNYPIITNTVTNTWIDTIPMYEISIEESACEPITINAQTYSFSGTYYQIISNPGSCDSLLTLTLSIGPDMTITQENSIYSVASADAYQWVRCPDFEPVPNATEQTFTPTTSGQYAVIIQEGMCTDTSECFTVFILNVNQNFNRDNIVIFPNPANSGQVQLSYPTEFNSGVLDVFDVSGRLLMSRSLTHSTMIVDTPKESGIYTFRLRSSNGFAISRLVMIE